MSSPFQAQGEISPGKNALLHCTTAGFTPLRLDHESFAASCPLALLGSAFYPVLVHRLAAYAPRFLPTLGHPRAVALHFVRCDQLTAGLAPAGVRPCWAHKIEKAPHGGLFYFWRRGWDSNPRYAKRTLDFESSTFGHSVTSPGIGWASARNYCETPHILNAGFYLRPGGKTKSLFRLPAKTG